jgi:hypothetical protein
MLCCAGRVPVSVSVLGGLVHVAVFTGLTRFAGLTDWVMTRRGVFAVLLIAALVVATESSTEHSILELADADNSGGLSLTEVL